MQYTNKKIKKLKSFTAVLCFVFFSDGNQTTDSEITFNPQNAGDQEQQQQQDDDETHMEQQDSKFVIKVLPFIWTEV